jgi:hypothetical protein
MPERLEENVVDWRRRYVICERLTCESESPNRASIFIHGIYTGE